MSGWTLLFGLVITRRSAICARLNGINANLTECATSLSELCMLVILRAKSKSTSTKKRKRKKNNPKSNPNPKCSIRALTQVEEGVLKAVTEAERVASLSDAEKAPLIDEVLDEDEFHEDEDEYSYDLSFRPDKHEIAAISSHTEKLGNMFNLSTNIAVVSDDGHWGSNCCVLRLSNDEEKMRGNVEMTDMDGTAAVGMPVNFFNVSKEEITSLKFVSTVLGLNDIQNSPVDLEDYGQSHDLLNYNGSDGGMKKKRKEAEEKERKVRALSREPQWIHIGWASFC